VADVQNVLIVGGGAAGYTAGLFAARDRRRARRLENLSEGSQATSAGEPVA
jgi:thioredoxin reductase